MTNSYESHSAAEHRRTALGNVGCALVTVSDTRTVDNDASGLALSELLAAAGHKVIERVIVPDEPVELCRLVTRLVAVTEVAAILLTGGTGIAPRDQTPEALRGLFTRMLSYQEIGAAAMLSRACGGLIGQTLVLTMPGSPAAVRLAMEKLILPELAHMVGLAARSEE